MSWRAKPTTTGVWERVGRRHYEHVTGLAVKWDGTAWQVHGGADDGHRYTTLTVAQHAALRHLTKRS